MFKDSSGPSSTLARKLIDESPNVKQRMKLQQLKSAMSCLLPEQREQLERKLDELSDLFPEIEGIEPDFAHSLYLFDSDPFISNPQWRKQLQISSENLTQVKLELTLVDADTLKQNYFPQWDTKLPKATMQKRRTRGQLLALQEDSEWLYPVEQFIPGFPKPEVSETLQTAVSKCREIGLTDVEIMHWLISPETVSEPRKNHQLDTAIEQNSFEQAMTAIAQKGPAEKISFTPLSLLIAGNEYAFNHALHTWIAPEENQESAQKQSRIAQWKALLSAEGISPEELLEANE